MDLRWLEDVLVLLEERNLTKAAARRNVTQPAFSRRIRSFEAWMGTQLLERRANRVDISPSLLANEAEIRSLIARLQDLRHKINTFKPERTNITIATQHALIFSAFPDMAALTRQLMPSLSFRLRAGNRSECISMFLRGDASILLCYEGEGSKPMPFDSSVHRDQWGTDRLVPLIGGRLRFTRAADGSIPELTPAIVYPESSHFGDLLSAAERLFSTRSRVANPVCETAFSAGIKEMVMKGLGVAWLPVSMVYKEIESGQIVDLSAVYGSVALKIAFYTDAGNDVTNAVRAAWRQDLPTAQRAG